MNDLWIICCGLPRSGSTLQYNIVAEIVEKSKMGKRMGFVQNDDFLILFQKEEKNNMFKVIKTHELSPLMVTLIKNKKAIFFSCYRDLREVAISYNSVWNTSYNEFIINGSLDFYLNKFYEFKVLSPFRFVSYKALKNNIPFEIKTIAKLLNISLDDSQIHKITNNNSLETRLSLLAKDDEEWINYNGYKLNPHTLLHHNHITDNLDSHHWQSKLSKWNIFKIELFSNFWLKETRFIRYYNILYYPSIFLYKAVFIKKVIRKLWAIIQK
jgi:hypothetical protein